METITDKDGDATAMGKFASNLGRSLGQVGRGVLRGSYGRGRQLYSLSQRLSDKPKEKAKEASKEKAQVAQDKSEVKDQQSKDRAKATTATQKALPAGRSQKALPGTSGQKALPSAGDSLGSKSRRDPEEKKRQIIARGGSVSEQFIQEVQDMKKDKVDKVIDIMRGKNKIEVMPKESNVKESVKIEDANGNHYAEFIDIIKPEPLKATKGIGSEILDEKCWVGYKQKGMKKKGDRMVPNCVKEGHSNWRQELGESAAWTRKEGKAKSGGLNEKGRKSYERENPGSDLKAPSKKVGNKRRASFCARMKGMKKKLTSKKTASDPNSRINKSLRAWNC